MKISVIIPTYNRGYIIGEAIASVLSQSYADFEVLVVDDGSTDETQEVVQTLTEGRVRYLRCERNDGCSAAYNVGISAATGQLIAFLDSDDIWKTDYLDRQVSFLTRHTEVDVVFSDTEIREERTTIPSLIGLMTAFSSLLDAHPQAEEFVFTARQMYVCLLEEVPIKPSACVIRRKVLEKAGGFDTAWPSGTDWDLFLRLSRFASFGYINQQLVVQRRTGDATHQKFLTQDKRFLLQVFAKEKDGLRNDKEALAAVNRGMARHFNSLGWAYLEREEGKKALRVYFEGLVETFDPMLLKKIMSGLIRIAGMRATKRHCSARESLVSGDTRKREAVQHNL